MVRLTDRPDMTLDVYRGRKITMQQQQQFTCIFYKDMSLNTCAFFTLSPLANHLLTLESLAPWWDYSFNYTQCKQLKNVILREFTKP